MKDETYGGWTNRETWCMNLHITNDEGDYRTSCETVEWGGAKALQDLWEEILDPATYTDGDEPINAEAMKVLYDVGSVYRINWQEIADGLTEE